MAERADGFLGRSIVEIVAWMIELGIVRSNEG